MDLSFQLDVDTRAAREQVAQMRSELPARPDVVEQMIKESGCSWLEARDRSETGSEPVLVTDCPDTAVYLERRENYLGDVAHIDGWVIVQQSLLSRDAAAFYAAFGSEWHWLLRSHVEVNGKLYKLRAFIKNGRTEGWSISLDMNVDAGNEGR